MSSSRAAGCTEPSDIPPPRRQLASQNQSSSDSTRQGRLGEIELSKTAAKGRNQTQRKKPALARLRKLLICSDLDRCRLCRLLDCEVLAGRQGVFLGTRRKLDEHGSPSPRPLGSQRQSATGQICYAMTQTRRAAPRCGYRRLRKRFSNE